MSIAVSPQVRDPATKAAKCAPVPLRESLASATLAAVRASHAEAVSLLGDLYDRVAAARPFLRWAGGKSTFVTRLGPLLPDVAGRYFEPFLGSGAVFFYLQARHGRPLEAVLGDTNRPLIRAYLAIRNDPDLVAQELGKLAAAYEEAPDRAAFYYSMRTRYNSQLPSPDAALFIFLNRTCWNGLYRVNRSGQFNVPFGRSRSEASYFPSEGMLISVSGALVRARLKSSSWESTIVGARRGDFVFLDPPYFSEVEKDDMKYRHRSFGLDSHEALASRMRLLADRDVSFVLTNSAEREMVELYSDHNLQADVVKMPRVISSKTGERRAVSELVVTPRGSELSKKLLYLT